MVEIRQIEDLQIDPSGARFLPAFQCRSRLVDGAGDTVLAELAGLPPDRRRPALDGRLVLADAGHERGGVDELVPVALDVGAGHADPPALLGEPLDRHERRVELGGEASGQRRGSPRASSADDDRHAAGLDGLGQRRRVGDGPDRARVVEALPERRRPEPGQHLELLLETVEALAEWWERDAVGVVLALVPAGAETDLDPP